MYESLLLLSFYQCTVIKMEFNKHMKEVTSLVYVREHGFHKVTFNIVNILAWISVVPVENWL